MAVVARIGPPTLMVTVTANPAWPEIAENLRPGQTGMDRPDLISRAFKVKLKHLLADLRQGLFGRKAKIYDARNRMASEGCSACSHHSHVP